MKKILMVVDYQYDFVSPTGVLTVPNADKLAKNIQNRVDSIEYDYRIYTFDTHTKEQYNGSAEQELFPNIHCEYGTKGWELYNIIPRNNKEFNSIITQSKHPFGQIEFDRDFFFTKDVFNIWEGNSVYPIWFEQKFPKNKYEIDVVGVATEFCVKMNIQGLTDRGYKVNLIQDCVAGITEKGVSEAMETFKETSVNFK